jgi:hypothetical protein
VIHVKRKKKLSVISFQLSVKTHWHTIDVPPAIPERRTMKATTADNGKLITDN